MNTIASVHGTASDSASGLTLVEQYLEKKYLAERDFNTPMVQSSYFSRLSLPKKSGQFVKYTRRRKARLPEVATEATDPLSMAPMGYDQILVPIEFINDATSISTLVMDTSWLDLAKDVKELLWEALRRYHNRAAQAAMVGGRYKPGKRNSSGVTVGDATYPHFFTEQEKTVTLYGTSFTFEEAPRLFGGGVAAFADLDASTYHTMNDYRRAKTRLRNAGARPFADGKYVAVISESIKADLERDDKYFQAAIRNMEVSKQLFKGELADYAGMHWVMDDEPWVLKLGDGGYKLDTTGTVHVAHVFGMDSFGALSLGGESIVKPKFKVQDISVTGNKTTIGYVVPSQAVVLNRAWAVNVIGTVSEPEANA